MAEQEDEDELYQQTVRDLEDLVKDFEDYELLKMCIRDRYYG